VAHSKKNAVAPALMRCHASRRDKARAIRCMYFREMQSIDPRARVHPGFQKHIGRQSLVITAQEGRFVFLAVPEWPHEK